MSDSLRPHRLQHARLSCPSLSPSLLKLMFIESVMPSNHLILCHPLLLLPSVFPSIRVSSNESVLRIRWPKYWSFSFSINPSHEYSGLVSFRMDWSDLLAVQGTLKSLFLHHGSKASILQRPPERVPVPWWPGKDGNQQSVSLLLKEREENWTSHNRILHKRTGFEGNVWNWKSDLDIELQSVGELCHLGVTLRGWKGHCRILVFRELKRSVWCPKYNSGSRATGCFKAVWYIHTHE